MEHPALKADAFIHCRLIGAVDRLLAEHHRGAGHLGDLGGDLERLIDQILSGDDATSRELILRGGDGVISVTANVAPALMQRMCQAALAGDLETAAALDAGLAGLHRSLFLEANPIPVKWALAEMGMIEKGIRLPMTWLSEEFHEAVRQALVQAELL